MKKKINDQSYFSQILVSKILEIKISVQRHT